MRKPRLLADGQVEGVGAVQVHVRQKGRSVVRPQGGQRRVHAQARGARNLPQSIQVGLRRQRGGQRQVLVLEHQAVEGGIGGRRGVEKYLTRGAAHHRKAKRLLCVGEFKVRGGRRGGAQARAWQHGLGHLVAGAAGVKHLHLQRCVTQGRHRYP